jgi:hypothetical protein
MARSTGRIERTSWIELQGNFRRRKYEIDAFYAGADFGGIFKFGFGAVGCAEVV